MLSVELCWLWLLSLYHLIDSQQRSKIPQFKLKGNANFELIVTLSNTAATLNNNIGARGHEFICSFGRKIGQEYNSRVISNSNPEEDKPFANFLGEVNIIVPFNVVRDANDGVMDLLIEV